ncbi:MAG TPA: Rieske 2Fe-2S domain-containing protein [Dehalococcoidia bacterium]|nr:Rieske 2Fe-2S domain-containing protein [Dehalococcoidia bacterium]
MLSTEDNRLITQAGQGTPMGTLFRRHWLPAMLSSELPEADCPPVRLRLLGEDLVAFRTTSGRVGVIDTYCPHRNANLFWGRNEEEGLRCVYHGWKFDVEGRCVDMPSEPPSSRYADKVTQPAYAAVDKGGVIWVYMGPANLKPELPQLEWTLVGDNQRKITKRIQRCNWLQNLEGELDSSHISFLHSRISPDRGISGGADTHPVFEVRETDYGLAISARRNTPDGRYYWRVTPYMLPSYTIIPTGPGELQTFTGAIPIDDFNMMGFTVSWNADGPISPEQLRGVASVGGAHAEVDSRFFPVRNKENDYMIDRLEQKTSSFSGITGVREQDMAVQEDQRGPVSDRPREHLGTSDLGVIAARRLLLKQAKALQQGIEPAQASEGAVYRVRSAAITADSTIPWPEAVKEHMLAVVV